MYAIIESGSKQYRVEEGDVIDVELLEDEKTTEFKKIICLHDGKSIEVGSPYLSHIHVKGEILESIRAPKVMAFRFKRRKNQRRRKGHRQSYCRVKITSIEAKSAIAEEESSFSSTGKKVAPEKASAVKVEKKLKAKIEEKDGK